MTDELRFVAVFLEDPHAIDVEVCKQGPEGPPAGDQTDFGTVALGTNEDVSFLPLVASPGFIPIKAVMYIITVKDTAGLQSTTVVQATITQNGTDVSWTRYGTIGDAVPFNETLSVVGSNLVLNIDNLHTADFDVSFLRIVTEA